MEPDPAVVVFSDVESILPDSGPFTLVKALEACDVLARHRIPVVLCSGRTRAQLERVQRTLTLSHPFICEHGAAVFVPIDYFPERVPAAREVAGFDVIEFVRPYAQTVEALSRTAKQLRLDVTGFHDMSVEAVATASGLSLLEAQLAKLREYSEPFRIHRQDDRARDVLFKALRAEGISCASGKPYHCAGVPANRQAGLALAQDLYERAFQRRVLMVDFATAAEHLPMLGDGTPSPARSRGVVFPAARREKRRVWPPAVVTLLRRVRSAARRLAAGRATDSAVPVTNGRGRRHGPPGVQDL